MSKTAIVWLRKDLRLADNPALAHACQHYQQIILVYIWDPMGEADWPAGAASRWWLHHSLQAFDKSLRQRGSQLIIRQGDSQAELIRLIDESKATAVFWNRRYEPSIRERDADIKRGLKKQPGLECGSFNASLWWEPWQLKTQQGKPYRVFTPMWKRMLQDWRYPDIAATPENIPQANKPIESTPLKQLKLLPEVAWDSQFYRHWQPGEKAAWERFDGFKQNVLPEYLDKRDYPSIAGISGLSPYLHHGEISIRQIVRQLCPGGTAPIDESIAGYLRQLAWREFSWYLLYHFPDLPTQPLQAKFANFRWRDKTSYQTDLKAWQQGQTGIPIIDAGMRELWATGTMHNRVRMLVASFLTKNLMIPWQEGAAWFWETLVDADLANNSQGWQWTAGCGVDASPYFRIFNPVTQSQRFDSEGHYVRHWVPELSEMNDRSIHSPWLVDSPTLQRLDIKLGKTYPLPMVDLVTTRQRALAAYQEVR